MIRFCRPRLHALAILRATAAVPLLFAFFSCIVGTGLAKLTGSWESQVRLDREADTWEVEGELTAAISGAAWEVEGVCEYDLEAWRKLEVEASAEVSGIELGSKITFDPTRKGFKKLATDLSFETHGWVLDAGFDLYPDHSWTDVRARCELDPCELDVKTRLGASKAFSFDFYRADVEISFVTCGVPVDVAGRFTAKRGFEWIDIETVIVLPPLLSWLAIEAETRLTLGGPRLSFEPEVDALAAWEGLSASIELFGEVVVLGMLGLGGLSLVGVAVDSSWGEAWIESRTSFEPAWNKKIVGRKEYGRAVGIGYEAEDSYGREVTIEAWAYSVDPSELSVWDRMVLVLAVCPAASREFALTAAFQPGSIVEIALELDIDW